MKTGTGAHGRILNLCGGPVRFTSKPHPTAPNERLWGWRSVNDPRMFGTGFKTFTEAALNARRVLIRGWP
jgi:hypothetical protein